MCMWPFRNRKEDAAQTLDLMAGAGGQGAELPFDVRDRDAVAQAFARVQRERKGLDVLVNNAGLTRDALFPLLAPVFAGQRLDYCARRTHTAGDLIRSEVEAEVDGRVVARGSMDSIVKIVAPPSASLGER
jgi:NAD(P)-dependent dehydrogenase (short-subunit alcohol dehydrogenase family)